jgi:hypothetical protein
MKKKIKKPAMPSSTLQRLATLFEATHQRLQFQAAHSVNVALVVRNWLFGFYIVEFERGGAERSELYGKKLIASLAAALTERGLKGTSPTNLRKFRAFYEAYPEIQQTPSVESAEKLSGPAEIHQPASVESLLAHVETPQAIEALAEQWATRFRLGWSHYVTLLTLSNPEERRFYEIEATANSWSVRELERQIDSSLYERLALSRDKEEIRRLAEQGLVIQKAADIIKNPMDLVFYNRLLRCYVLIDLKRNKLTHQDLGQMQMYVNHFDRSVKTKEEASTIGIVLCHRKNDALVELTLPKDSNIYASEYQLYLPSKEELQQKLIDWIQEVSE